ncbi:MAG: metallophosphoesterase family protein [Hyphomonadaceae bacterium]
MTFNKHVAALALLLSSIALAVSQPAQGQSTVESSTVRPVWQLPSVWPDRIVATISADPATSFSVTWRTDETVGVAIAEIAPAIHEARFDLSADTVNATAELIDPTLVSREGDVRRIVQNAGLRPVAYHSVTFSGLKPDTLYAYRVRGAPGAWSPWRQIRTAPLDGPFTFLFFGDSQTGIRSHITRTFDEAVRVAPNARFAMHGGDLVNTAEYDKEWAEWFQALGAFAQTVPQLLSPGNHDYFNFAADDVEDDKLFISPRAVTHFWRAQFELPTEAGLPADLQETVYDVRYTKDVHVFSIDSSGVDFDRQLEWLAKSLDASDATWKILYMHHPLYSFVGGREHPAHKERRLAINKMLKAHHVDLILTGHRHSYQRGEIGKNVASLPADTARKIDTLFLITATTTKRGQSKADGWERFSRETGGTYKLRRYADNIPLFVVFDVDGPSLSARVLDATGGEYDAFHLSKNPGGGLTIVDGPSAAGATLTFDNTATYKAWDDLR